MHLAGPCRILKQRAPNRNKVKLTARQALFEVIERPCPRTLTLESLDEIA